MESPMELEVLKFRKEVLDTMKRDTNHDDIDIFSLQLLSLVWNRQQQQQQQQLSTSLC